MMVAYCGNFFSLNTHIGHAYYGELQKDTKGKNKSIQG